MQRNVVSRWGFSSRRNSQQSPQQNNNDNHHDDENGEHDHEHDHDLSIEDDYFDGDNDDDVDDDEYSDQEMPHRQRSRSFGDAEDTLLNGSSAGYYESFTLETPTADANNAKSLQSSGLHHRTNTSAIHQRSQPYRMRNGGHQSSLRSPQQPGIGYEFYRTPTPKRKPPHPGYHGVTGHFHSSASWFRRNAILRYSLFFGIAFYVVLLIRSSYWMLDRNSNAASHANNYPHYVLPAGIRSTSDSHWVHSLSTPQFSESVIFKSQQRLDARRLAVTTMNDRAAHRRQRTIPHKPQDEISSAPMPWYSTLRIDQRPPAAVPSSTQSAPVIQSSPLSTLDQLCGTHARNESLLHPERYPSQLSLNGKSARVLITGILNPVGFQLAMHLHHHCGVQVIGGLDAQYPNTVENRVQLQDRLRLLVTTIPKLIKPIALPFIGLDPKMSDKDKHSPNAQQEFDFMAMQPTHIVHLASYDQYQHLDGAVDPTWRNLRSPYVTANADEQSHLFPLRTSMVAMEQILNSVASAPADQRPNIIYATTDYLQHHPVHAAAKYIDEILVEAYQIPSIALRLPNAVYGPWGQAGSVVHDMMETAITRWNSTQPGALLTAVEESTQPNFQLNMLHVDDVVNSIVAAMQYRAHTPVTVHLSSHQNMSMAQLAKTLESYMSSQTFIDDSSSSKSLVSNVIRTDGQGAHALWTIEPQTSLQQGLTRTMAWHLNRDSPFGPSKETADQFLKRQGEDICDASDWQCHKSDPYFPCLSECNTREQCIPSIFDEVQKLLHDASEGCDYVLYTQSLGYNVKDLELYSEYMDDAHLHKDEKLVCNFAFVPRDSDLVAAVISKVPSDQLKKFGIKLQPTDTSKDMQVQKLNGLNGRLLYRGWILVWVKDAMGELSATDKSLLKLSPGKLFFPQVSHAMFVEENFNVSPTIEDVLFLIHEMKRHRLHKRTVKKEVMVKVNGKDVMKRKKYRLPEEPQRRAAILFPPLRFPSVVSDHDARRYKSGEKKLTVHDAAKFMRYELGKDAAEKESDDVRRQREHYERVPSYINRNSELRSPDEPWYRYSMRHWVRSRWVIHDLHLEDSRLLRCDWYQEHIAWGNDLDQLSFAHVMAIRELKRRIAHMEPDDHIKTFIEQHPDLRDVTDSYEWHALETEPNKLHREPVHWQPQIPEHFNVDDEDEETHDALEEVHESQVPLYVRIMSERVMAASRKYWAKARKKSKKVTKHK